MIPKINPIQTSAWKKLTAHYAEMKTVRMKTLFDSEPDRFEQMSIYFNELLFDYSKNIITGETKKYLLELADEFSYDSRFYTSRTKKRYWGYKRFDSTFSRNRGC